MRRKLHYKYILMKQNTKTAVHANLQHSSSPRKLNHVKPPSGSPLMRPLLFAFGGTVCPNPLSTCIAVMHVGGKFFSDVESYKKGKTMKSVRTERITPPQTSPQKSSISPASGYSHAYCARGPPYASTCLRNRYSFVLEREET